MLNGIDYTVWNPEDDHYISDSYSAKNIEGKAKNKKALRDRLLLQESDKPIVAFIGRLDEQKGVHLLHHAIYYALQKGAQFVLLGSATEASINDVFWHEKQYLNDNSDCHLELGFDEELSHLIYAGADMIIVPSNYEPCGLTQMIGMRYGTVPIVRGVGGVVSTVFDWDYDPNHPGEERNGFVFYQTDYRGLESAMERAIDLWKFAPDRFEALAVQGMNYDYSWKQSAETYSNIYDFIRHK